jgi:hypothetical protein
LSSGDRPPTGDGENAYDRDRDVLVVLGACRPGTLRDAAAEYAFLDAVETVRSVGDWSSEW